MATPTADEEEEHIPKTFTQDLAEAFKGSNRTKVDRYRDFQKVFLGSEEGKRVLHDILGFAKLSAAIAAPFPEPVDEKRMMILEGGRQLAITIITVLHKQHDNEERPNKTRSIR